MKDLEVARTNDAGYIRQIVLRLNSLVDAFSKPTLGLALSSAPVASTDAGLLWVAKEQGTKDGQAYEKGDLLYSANIAGISKTVLMVDWSAF